MKILHTSDWHLGRTFKGESLIEDHQYFLDQVMLAIEKNTPDVLIIAGDIFDRSSPPASAVNQFESFQRQVYFNTKTALVILAGNHDSGDRLGINGVFADPSRVLIRGRLESDDTPLVLEDEHGLVAFSALPYGEMFSARECFDDLNISSPADVLMFQVKEAKKQIPENARWVICAHAFVTGATTTETERSLSVGGIETVSKDVFDGAHYVALGHLHRAQKIGHPHIRYSGSPLAFAFDEANSEKSMSLVTLDAEGMSDITMIPIKPLRNVREIRGSLIEIEAMIDNANRNDFIQAILTDKGGLVDPMARIRKIFPNTMALVREHRRELTGSNIGRATAKLDNPNEVLKEFIAHVRQEPISEIEQTILDAACSDILRMES